MAQLERLAERLRVRIAEVESMRDAMAKLEGCDPRDAFQRDCGELAGLKYAALAVKDALEIAAGRAADPVHGGLGRTSPLACRECGRTCSEDSDDDPLSSARE